MPESPPRLSCKSKTKRAVVKVAEKRESAAKRGYGRAWQKAREGFLRKHPLCECDECQAGVKRVMAATVVDHKVPHRGDKVLFWDRNNWQAMAASCHNKKTAREDGGFGNRTASTS
ncbi:MAG: HNH endonuclease [Gammaproteobacteria bacterium]|nr:HNH endonuclease [Gammaproteobacteria bacterium]